MALWDIYAVECGSTLINSLTQQAIELGTEVRAETASGGLYATTAYIVEQITKARFTSQAIASALNAVGQVGDNIAGMSGGLKMYSYKHADGGTRAAGSSHRKYTFTKGIIVPVTLTCDHPGDASLSFQVHPTYDGNNNPLQITESVAVPAGASDTTRFTLGPVTVGGVTLDDESLKRTEIEFGLNVQVESGGGAIWPTQSSIGNIFHKVRFRGINPEWLAESGAVPLLGVAATHANTTIYFRKRDTASGTFVADGTAEHVKITADGAAVITTIEGDNNNPSESALEITTRYDGVNLPLVINTAAAIT